MQRKQTVNACTSPFSSKLTQINLKVSEEEVSKIFSIYNSICVDPSYGFTKTTFGQAVYLSQVSDTLFRDKLFSLFASKKETIDFHDFVLGLASILKANTEDKAKRE